MALSLMTVVSAVSGLNVALPSLAREIGATQTELTWIVDSYTVVFAGLLLAAGAIGDRLGRKGILIVGLIIFGAAAAGAAFTTDANSLIVLRAVMGIGAAGIMPTTLSVITTSFPDAERPKAIGVWVGVAGSGAVLGLFGTGLLLEFFEWHSFFWLNVTLAILGVGLVALVLFVLWERHHPDPLLDPRLFALRGFSAGSLTILIQFFAAFGFFFTMLQYLQFVVDLSPLMAAICMLPMPLAMVPLARLSPTIAARVGYRKVVPAGLALMAVGFGIMSLLTVDFNHLHFVSGLVVFAAGMGLAGTPSTTAITQSLPREKQGVASAVNDVARELGSALGIAVLGGVLTSVYRTSVADATTQLPADIAERVQESIAFTQTPMISALGSAADALTVAARAAFVDATAASLLIAAAALVATAIMTAVIGPRHVKASTARSSH